MRRHVSGKVKSEYRALVPVRRENQFEESYLYLFTQTKNNTFPCVIYLQTRFIFKVCW